MRTILSKTLSVLMVIVTSIGLLLSIFILVQIWRYRQPLTDKIQTGIGQTSVILETTGEGLDIIDQVVKNVYSSTIYLHDTTNDLEKTIQSTNLFIDSVGTFVGEDLINTITNTQRTLVTAQASALVIDNILTTLSHVPLIGINYKPSVPLNISLGQVATSLDSLPGSLKSFQVNLKATSMNMQDFKDQLLILDQNIIAINENLASSQAVIDDYSSQVTSLISWVDKIKISLPVWMNIVYWAMTITILWLVLIQLSILLQGLTMLSSAKPAKEAYSEH